MLKSDAFVQATTSSSDEPRFNEPISNEEYDRIFWRNRSVIARLNGIRVDDKVKTKAALGAAFLATLAEITDDRERATILGDFLGAPSRGDTMIEAMVNEMPTLATRLAALSNLSASIRAAAEKGEPCPLCGKMHKESEGHK